MTPLYALVLDYGSHQRVDSMNEDVTKLGYDRLNLLDAYRKQGFRVDHLMDGSSVLFKQVGSRPSPYGLKDATIHVYTRIHVRIEKRMK